MVKSQFGGGCRDKYHLVVVPCDAQSLLGHVVLFFNLPGMAKNAGGQPFIEDLKPQKCTKFSHWFVDLWNGVDIMWCCIFTV